MSWDKKLRGGKHRYYYQSVRINGRSVKRYVGHGPAAELIARLDERERQDRQAARQAWLSEQIQIAAADLALQEARTLVDLLTHATLILQGYYHHHGEWRHRP